MQYNLFGVVVNIGEKNFLSQLRGGYSVCPDTEKIYELSGCSGGVSSYKILLKHKKTHKECLKKVDSSYIRKLLYYYHAEK